MQTVAYRIAENGKALKELTEKHGVILHDTPPDYFVEYRGGALRSWTSTRRRTRSSRRCGTSMKSWPTLPFPFWAQAQSAQRQPGRRVRSRAGQEEEVAPSMMDREHAFAVRLIHSALYRT